MDFVYPELIYCYGGTDYVYYEIIVPRCADVGQVVLYRWPVEGWVRGTVAGRSRAAGFSHVVRYGRTSALGSAVVPSLLDAASHARPAGKCFSGAFLASLASL